MPHTLGLDFYKIPKAVKIKIKKIMIYSHKNIKAIESSNINC